MCEAIPNPRFLHNSMFASFTSRSSGCALWPCRPTTETSNFMYVPRRPSFTYIGSASTSHGLFRSLEVIFRESLDHYRYSGYPVCLDWITNDKAQPDRPLSDIQLHHQLESYALTGNRSRGYEIPNCT
jgi:hypothetical protein